MEPEIGNELQGFSKNEPMCNVCIAGKRCWIPNL